MKRGIIFGWIESLLGILLIGIGFYTLITPDAALNGVVIAYGLVGIVAGIAYIVLYVCFERRKGLSLFLSILAGICSILIGALIFLDFIIGVWAFTILSPIWFLIHCAAYQCSLNVARLPATKIPQPPERWEQE